MFKRLAPFQCSLHLLMKVKIDDHRPEKSLDLILHLDSNNSPHLYLTSLLVTYPNPLPFPLSLHFLLVTIYLTPLTLLDAGSWIPV